MNHEFYPPKVLYEDNHIIAIEKPPGLLSQKDKIDSLSANEIVKEYLKEKYNKQGNVYLALVHRLDRPVGGVLVFGKTSKMAARLSEVIQKGEFHKYYLALVEGVVLESSEINIKIKKNEKKLKAYLSDDGLESRLLYKPLKVKDNFTLLEVSPLNGRFHQIRLSLSTISHPIVNDIKYGSHYKIDNKDIFLWAYKVKFIHPVTYEEITIESKPVDWFIK